MTNWSGALPTRTAIERGKLADVGRFRDFMSGARIEPVTHKNLIAIDSGRTPAADAAAQIVAHYKLEPPETESSDDLDKDDDYSSDTLPEGTTL